MHCGLLLWSYLSLGQSCSDLKAHQKEDVMGIILVLLILALIFGGLGFAIHALWIVAVVLLIAWAVMFRSEGTSERGRNGNNSRVVDSRTDLWGSRLCNPCIVDCCCGPTYRLGSHVPI